MGDVSTEPSMEDILSSIKRIIAEEGDAPVKPRRQPRAEVPAIEPAAEPHEVLELDQPVDAHRPPEPVAQPEPAPAPVETAAVPDPAPTPAAVDPDAVAAPAAPQPADRIVSHRAAAAARGSLYNLSRLTIRPEPGSDGTLEGLVRELLRPMLKAWLDAHLPALVETLVEREIARITAEHR